MTSSDWYTPFETMSDQELRRYAWHDDTGNQASAIYRIPYSEQLEVGAVKIEGNPINQYSFREKDGQLQVLTHIPNDQELYSRPNSLLGTVYFTALDLEWFDQRLYEHPSSNYTTISVNKPGSKLNRFIGDHLLYVNNIWGEGSEPDDVADVHIFSTKAESVATSFITPNHIQQIQKTGQNALLVGYADDDNLFMSSLRLDTDQRIVNSVTLDDLELSAFRSHGFSYKPNLDGGIFAIPLDIETAEGKTWKRENGIYYDLEPTTKILYTQLGNDLTMKELGALEGSKEAIWTNNDDCKMSCVDWYGSSRPIFWDDRIFSLIKYELIEGVLKNEEISEVSRIYFK